jgi:hypothetical protein
MKFNETNLFLPCEVLILDVETKEVQQATTIPNGHEHEKNSKPAWSPTDYRLAYIHSESTNHSVKILGFGRTPPTTSEIEISTNTGIQPIWSPDAKSILVDGAMMLSIATVRDGVKIELLDLGLGLYAPVSWPAYERILLVGGGCCTSNIIIIKGQPLDIEKQEFKPWLNGRRFYQYEPDLSAITDEVIFIGVYDPGY